MTIKELIASNKPGKAGHWSITAASCDPILVLRHYRTPMVSWHSDHPAGFAIFGLGHGSFGDQNGVNTFFRYHKLPYYYSRADNDVRIVDLNDPDATLRG